MGKKGRKGKGRWDGVRVEGKGEKERYGEWRGGGIIIPPSAFLDPPLIFVLFCNCFVILLYITFNLTFCCHCLNFTFKLDII